MKTIKVYFVRHGESEANKLKIEQGAMGPLSEQGHSQAESAARRLRNVPFDLIVSSTFERARETTKIINSALNKDIIYSDLFIERLPPSETIGKSVDDPQVVSINEKMRIARQNPGSENWRYSDEENFDDFKGRAIHALEYLLTLDAERILVVTHGGFLRMLLAVMIFGHNLTYREYLRILFSLRTKNTGITICEHVEYPEPHRAGWKLVAWNDHAHLGGRVKPLRFRSHQVPHILSRNATITWRFFDEKGLQEGDELLLINSDTDRQFGRGVIVALREKKLKLIEQSELPTHGLFDTRESAYRVYQEYYGDEISFDTLVKIVKFALLPQ